MLAAALSIVQHHALAKVGLVQRIDARFLPRDSSV